MYELPKARAIYIGIILIILISLWFLKKIQISKLMWIVLVYLGVLFVMGVLQAPDQLQAFWGTYERQMGLLSYLHLFFFPFFLAEILKTIGTRPLYKIIAWGSFGSCLLALSQYTIHSPFSAVASFGFRLYGSFGEPNLLGYYIVLTLFPVWQVFKEYSWRSIAKYFYLLTLLLSCWTIIDSGSRGAMLALLASIVLTTIHHSKILFTKYWKQTFISLGLLLVILISIFNWQLQDRHSFISLRIFNNVTIAIRLEIWQTTLAEANKKWLLGHGLENLSPLFEQKSPRLKKLLLDPTETIDRAHNDALDHYYSTGIIGLLSYLFLIGAAFFYSIRLWQRKNILVPLGITLQFFIVSSVGPVHSIHVLLFTVALGILHIAEAKTAIKIPLYVRLLSSSILIMLLYYHLQIIVRDFK